MYVYRDVYVSSTWRLNSIILLPGIVLFDTFVPTFRNAFMKHTRNFSAGWWGVVRVYIKIRFGIKHLLLSLTKSRNLYRCSKMMNTNSNDLVKARFPKIRPSKPLQWQEQQFPQGWLKKRHMKHFSKYAREVLTPGGNAHLFVPRCSYRFQFQFFLLGGFFWW